MNIPVYEMVEKVGLKGENNGYQHVLLFIQFLAHLSITCSREAFRVVQLGQFGPNLAGMFLRRSSLKFVHRN